MDEQLSNLREIPLPDPFAYTPQTAGWYILLALVVLIVVFLIMRWRRSTLRDRYRSEALQLITEIELGGRPLSDLPALIKRASLAFTPREKIAELSGMPWLRFLDSTLGNTEFSTGPGKLLLTLSYETPESVEEKLTSEQRLQLLSLTRRWIRRHHAGV